MSIFWLAQGIGAIALALIVFSYQGKIRNQILIRQIFSALIFVVHYAMLFAWTGAFMNAIVVVRNWVFSKKDTNAWANNIAWVVLFSILSVGVLYFSWQGIISIFPVAGVLTGIYARWQDRAAQIRIFGLIGCVLWIVYTIAVDSYVGTVTQLIIAAGVIIGMLRHDRVPETASGKIL